LKSSQARRRSEDILFKARGQAASIINQRVQEAKEQASAILEEASDTAQNPVVSGRVAPLTSVQLMRYVDLSRSTGSFSSSALMGRGSSGGVYKAEGLKIWGRTVQAAIKRLDADSTQNPVEVLGKIQVLGGSRHECLLPLWAFSADAAIGHGDTPTGPCLVSPFLAGGSLQDRLFPDSEGARRRYEIMFGHEGTFQLLCWIDRLRICISCLKGLAYLHSSSASDSKPSWCHRNLKPHNILLDCDLHARLADAGLARPHPSQATHLTSKQVETMWEYADPHYVRTGHFDSACDAFAMGVIFLMVLSGKDAQDSLILDLCEDPSSIPPIDSVVDPQADWPPEVASQFLEICLGLVKTPRCDRLSADSALEKLEACLRSVEAPAPNAQHDRECFFCLSVPTTNRLPCGHSPFCPDCLHEVLRRERAECPLCHEKIRKPDAAQGDDSIALQSTFVEPVQVYCL